MLIPSTDGVVPSPAVATVIFLIADLQAPAEQQIVIPVVFGERLADYPVEHGRRRGGKIEVAGKIPVTAHLPCPELVRPAEIATRKTERREMQGSTRRN